MTSTLTFPTNFPGYLAAGFVGGSLGFYLMQKKEGASPSIMDVMVLESGLAGAVTSYLVIMSGFVDPTSLWKGALVGFGGEYIFNSFIKGMFVATASS